MDNNVKLTDDELAVIQTALQIFLLSAKKYEELGKPVDFLTHQTIDEFKLLYDRLEKEYF